MKSRLYRGMVCLLIWRIGNPERTRIARAMQKRNKRRPEARKR